MHTHARDGAKSYGRELNGKGIFSVNFVGQMFSIRNWMLMGEEEILWLVFLLLIIAGLFKLVRIFVRRQRNAGWGFMFNVHSNEGGAFEAFVCFHSLALLSSTRDSS